MTFPVAGEISVVASAPSRSRGTLDLGPGTNDVDLPSSEAKMVSDATASIDAEEDGYVNSLRDATGDFDKRFAPGIFLAVDFSEKSVPVWVA